MGTIVLLFVVGLVGSALFDHFNLPGGAMTGAMLAVILFKSMGSVTTPPTPHWLRFVVYGCVGVLVGNMYNPGMLEAVRDTWPVMLLSTSMIMLARDYLHLGCSAQRGALRGRRVSGHQPGGFNAMVALSGGTGQEAPIVMVYHLVRIYTIVLLAPLVGRVLGVFIK